MPEKSEYKDWEYFYNQMDENIETSLTYDQKEEIKDLLKRAARKPSEKIFIYRTSFWMFVRFYVVLYFGREKRTYKRFSDSETLELMGKTYKSGVFFVKLLILIIMTALMLYFIKSSLGIDIMKDKHLEDVIKEEINEKIFD